MEVTTEIKLLGTTDYNERFPPRDPKKGYVARITGRAAGTLKYQREFLGQAVAILQGDEGLYEKQRGDKKGGCTRWYHVVLSHPEHGLIISVDCEDELPKIAKLLDDGITIQDAVEVDDLRPSEKIEGRMVFTARARSTAQAKQALKSATIDSATEHCWEALGLLPETGQKKVLAALKARMAPKPTVAQPGQEMSHFPVASASTQPSEAAAQRTKP